MRNLFLLVTAPRNQEEDEQLRKVFLVILGAINNFPFGEILLSFQYAISAHSEDKLIRATRTKIGVAVISTFLKRGYEIVVRQLLTIPTPTSEVTLLINAWRQTLDMLVHKMTGKFVQLLSSTISAGYSNDTHANQIWDFFILLAFNITPSQKKSIIR